MASLLQSVSGFLSGVNAYVCCVSEGNSLLTQHTVNHFLLISILDVSMTNGVGEVGGKRCLPSSWEGRNNPTNDQEANAKHKTNGKEYYSGLNATEAQDLEGPEWLAKTVVFNLGYMRASSV